MNRLHLHIRVTDLNESIRYYSALFGTPPSVEKPDYAKWMPEDPRVNLSISPAGSRPPGIAHTGLQTDDGEGLEALHSRMQSAGFASQSEADAHCCYAHSDKYWSEDPSGVTWELFHTRLQVDTSGSQQTSSALIDKPAENQPEVCCMSA